MTRDYKPAKRNRGRRSSGSGSSLLVGILIGLLLGLGIALAVAIYLNKVPAPFLDRERVNELPAPPPELVTPHSGTKSEPPAARTDDKPRFDFYNILPGTEEGLKGKPSLPGPPPSATAGTKESFYLQAGAFQSPAEADNMRARLAMLGIEANIQSNASTERGTLHRVRIGPFNAVEEVNRTRETLKQNGIETTLIKGRDPAN
jgi:cell division protein FtsN